MVASPPDEIVMNERRVNELILLTREDLTGETTETETAATETVEAEI